MNARRTSNDPYTCGKPPMRNSVSRDPADGFAWGQIERGHEGTEKPFPESSRTISKFPVLPDCEVVVRPYRFFYRIKDSTVWVVAARHGVQPPQKPGASFSYDSSPMRISLPR